VVISGGAGFLGSHLTDRFLADGWRVLGVDNLSTGKRANIQHLRDEPRYELLQQDVSRPFDVAGPVDAVLHFASPASPLDYLELPVETLKVGAWGTFHCLDLAREHGATFLMASTSEVYGDPKVHPQVESYWGNVNPIGPRSVYDEAKRFAEAATMSYRREFGLDTRLIRIFNTYGPRMNHDDGRVVPAFVCQALRGEPLTVFGSGRQTRSFQYVQDLVAGVATVLEHGDDQPYNIGNPDEHDIISFARAVADTVGDVTVDHQVLPEDDPQRRCPDISRLTALGWQPSVTLQEGLRLTVDWFRAEIAAGRVPSATQPRIPRNERKSP